MALTEAQVQQENARRKEIFDTYLMSKEYQDKLMERLKLNDAGDRSAEARTYLWHLCARPDNPVEGAKFFINTFGWTFDPRPEHEPYHLPFITFEYQDRAIEWFIDRVDNGRDGLVEKSRDMGMSWLLFVWLPLWYWLFRDGTSFLLGSYKEALVDDRTPDSLFGKLDYAIMSLPKWILPNRFSMDKHRTKLRLTNPATGNLISGDTMNPMFGRGTRKTAILFDELGFWEYAKDAWEASGDATSCRIANSTPQGFNFFAMLKKTGIGTLTLLWKQHPLKDQTWYQFEALRRSPEELAQEIDLSYTKSREGRVYPEWSESFVQTGYFPYDDNKQLYVGWDFGKTDDTAIIWSQMDDHGRMRIVDVYRNVGRNIDFYIPFINGIISADSDGKYHYSPEEIDMILEHRNWARGTHFGDPAGRFQNQVSDETVFSVLKAAGIPMNFKDSWKEFKIRKSALKRLIMEGINLNDNSRTSYFDVCMLNASYPKSRVEGVAQVKSVDPRHDWTSHYRSAFEYLALGLEEGTQRKPQIFDKFKKKDRDPYRSVSY